MVLDGVDSSESSPILLGWDVDLVEDGWLWGLSNGVWVNSVEWSSVSEKFFVLLWGPGGHEVVADGEGVLWVGVDSLEFFGVGHEDLLSEHELFGGSVRDTVGGDVLEEVEVGVELVLESKGHKSGSEHLFGFNLLIIK